MPSTTSNALRSNVGVYTNPAHDLWIESAGPKAEDVAKGDTLQPGEVTVGIKSSGICGFALPLTLSRTQF
jgi:L-iditol 2-dehydrogenase